MGYLCSDCSYKKKSYKYKHYTVLYTFFDGTFHSKYLTSMLLINLLPVSMFIYLTPYFHISLKFLIITNGILYVLFIYDLVYHFTKIRSMKHEWITAGKSWRFTHVSPLKHVKCPFNLPKAHLITILADGN